MRAVVTGLLLVLCGACTRESLVGTIACSAPTDCAPPRTICGPDARCVSGCADNPASCIGGSTCDDSTGECSAHELIGTSCTDDKGCDPPDVVCSLSTHACVAGCPQTGLCGSGELCDPTSGHCCDASETGCISPAPAGTCHEDADCNKPSICDGSACVPGCTLSGCTAPLSCDTGSGHCAPATCARDIDCDALSYCTQAGVCAVLARPGASGCAGGATVYYDCAVDQTASEFSACAGAAGPAACPYCIDMSCFQPGLCSAPSDCHGGQGCNDGLCRATTDACPSTVSISSIVAGKEGAGRQVCVSGKVVSARSGYDGMIEIKLGESPYLYVDVPPMYEKAGVTIPTPGKTATVHGTVRWDAGHADWELLPVDWIGP